MRDETTLKVMHGTSLTAACSGGRRFFFFLSSARKCGDISV